MGIWCLRSSHIPTLRAGTPCLELFEPLGRCGVSTVHGHGRGHEEEAGQQSQDEGEPLGIHSEGGSEGLDRSREQPGENWHPQGPELI